MRSTKFKRYCLFGAPLLIVLAYILIAAFRIGFPGTEYDESLYLNAALGSVDKTTFITKTFHGFPILLMPYIGALKAYIFYPIFKIFGVSPLTMRLPDILLSALGLYWLYRLLSKQIGRRLSLAVIAFTALDASFIVFTRLDNGPVVLDFLLKIISLALLLRFAKDHRLWVLGTFWLVMLVGIFNKLNFIWYTNAFVGAFILVYGLGIWRKAKPKERLELLALSAAGYLLCVAYYLYISISYHLGSYFGFLGWQRIYSIIGPLVDGIWFYNYALSSQKIGSPIIFWLIILTVVAGTVSFGWRIRHKKSDQHFNKFYIFTGLSLLLLLVELAITKAATAGWHYFSIYPLLGIMFVLSVFELGKLKFAKNGRALYAAIMGIVAVFCVYQLLIYGQYVRLYGKPVSNPYWSSAIYQLSSFTKPLKAPVLSLDWGTQTQLQGFDPTVNKYFEVFGPVLVNDPVQNNFDFQRYISTKPGAYYVTHSPASQLFPEVTKDFFVLAKEHGYEPVYIKTINDGQTPVFEIYQLKSL